MHVRAFARWALLLIALILGGDSVAHASQPPDGTLLAPAGTGILSLVRVGEGTRARATSGPAAAMTRFFLSTTPVNNTTGASVAVDSSGGIHVGFVAETSTGGTLPAYYAYCASGCSSFSSWHVTAIGDLGDFGGFVRLALDPQGHPRMLWYRETDLSGPGIFQYAQCNTACTSSSSWTVVSTKSASLSPGNHYFALDPQGRPRFVYTDTDTGHSGTFYAFCNAGCTSPSGWSEGHIGDAYLLYDFSLTFDSSARPRMAYRNAVSGPDTLDYAECNTSCDQALSWGSIHAFYIGSGSAFTLRLDSTGRPRLAIYQGDLDGNPSTDLLAYAWCNASCTTNAGWSGYDLEFPQQHGLYVDMALDSQGRPRLAFLIDNTAMSTAGLGYAICSSNCESPSGSAWQEQIVETPDDLNASDPVPLESNCTISSWVYVGERPSIALDANGNPRIAYDTEHMQSSPSGPCSVHTDVQLVRFAIPNTGLPIYLPLITR